MCNAKHRFIAIMAVVTVQLAVLTGICLDAQAEIDWLKQAVLDAEAVASGAATDRVPHEEASVLVLHKSRRVEISPEERARTLVRLVMRPLRAGRVPPTEMTEHIGAYQRIENLRAWSISADGVVEELDPGEISTFSNPRDPREYGDDFMLSASSPGMHEGSIYALEYEIEEQGWTSLFQGFVFQHEQPVVFARFSLKLPGGWQYRAAGIETASAETRGVPEDPAGAEATDVEYSKEGSWHHWTAANLGFRPEMPLAPPPGTTANRITVSVSGPGQGSLAGFDDWEGVASWYAAIARTTALPDDYVIAETRRIVRGVEGTPDEIKAVASFVQDIRYVAVEIGEGKWIACPASETLSNRYGDCKDKTSLMLAMLAGRGISAVPVLMNPNSTINEELANPLQFSHVMVGIPVDSLPYPVDYPDATAGGWLLFDPSVEDIPLGALPVSAYGRLVLPCPVEGGRLVRLHLPEAGKLNHRRYSVKGTLNHRGDLSAEVVIVDKGYEAASVNRSRSRTPLDQQVAAWKSRILASAPAPRLSGYQYAPHADSAWARFHVEAPAYAAGGDSVKLLKMDFLHAALAPEVIEEGRTLPVYLGRRRLVDFEIDWQIPDTWTVRPRDLAGTMKTRVASLDYSINVLNENRLRFAWTVMYTGEMAGPDQFEDVRGILETLSNVHSLTVVLRREDGIGP